MDELITLAEQISVLFAEKNYTEIRRILAQEHPADCALLLQELPEEQASMVFRLLPKELGAEVFVNLESDDQEFLLKKLSDTELRAMMDQLFLDDAADMIAVKMGEDQLLYFADAAFIQCRHQHGFSARYYAGVQQRYCIVRSDDDIDVTDIFGDIDLMDLQSFLRNTFDKSGEVCTVNDHCRNDCRQQEKLFHLLFLLPDKVTESVRLIISSDGNR